MFSLRVMIEKSRGKKQQEETEKQYHVIVTEDKVTSKLDSGISHAVEDS